MLRRPVSWLTSAALLIGTAPPMPLRAQPAPMPMPGPPPGQVQAQLYSAEQLDSILAPIALYPDVLLTQVLMAAAFPFQIVEAGRWVQNPANQQLRGDALAQALAPMDWDPSVKSLVPFPGVLAQLNGNLQWLQQLGYASANQQPDVLDAVQRLRRQAEIAGNLRSSPQCVVRHEEQFIYIEPAQPDMIYVPAYNPTVVYGTWAYPAYPPVYLAPPMGYGWEPIVGAALVFGTAVAVSALLWDLGRPHWHDRNIFVNVNRYNTINVNRAPLQNQVWHPANTATYRTGGGLVAPRGITPRPGAATMPGAPLRGPQGGGFAPGQQQYRQGGAGTGVLQPSQQPHLQGGPGTTGHPSGGAPGLQQRNLGGPGTAGQSGVAPPGLQPRTPGAPGTAGHSGVAPPGLQQRNPGGPGTAGHSGISPPGYQGQGSLNGGASHSLQGGSMPGGGQSGHSFGGPSNGGGFSPGQTHMQGGSGGAPQHFAPQGGGQQGHNGGGGGSNGGGHQDQKRHQP